MRRKLHNYKREFGGTQKQLVFLYLSRGKTYNEIQELLKCPRPSIRRCSQQLGGSMKLTDYLKTVDINPNALKEILKNQESAEAFRELHEAGFVRIKYESLKKLQEDAEKWERATKTEAWEEFTKYRLTYEQLKKEIKSFEGMQLHHRKGLHPDEIKTLNTMKKILENKADTEKYTKYEGGWKE